VTKVLAITLRMTCPGRAASERQQHHNNNTEIKVAIKKEMQMINELKMKM
jgi:hypothetical protein